MKEVRGIAQLVARIVRDDEVASSNLATPTLESLLILLLKRED